MTKVEDGHSFEEGCNFGRLHYGTFIILDRIFKKGAASPIR